VGQQGTLTHVWSERGSRPPAVRDDRHDSAWLFGAVCPERATGAAVVMPWVSSEAMSEHLALIGQAVASDAHAVLVCDGAGWHQSGGRLRIPPNLSLLPLPSYAPQLNPVENVWEYLRANYLSISVWDTYDQIVDACCRAWNAFISDTHRVVSITRRDWATVSF
jgi:transposase